MFSADAPVFTENADGDVAMHWSDIYGQLPYRNTIFYKGPLLALSQNNIDATSLPSLFNLNMYKKSVKRMLIEQQSEGTTDDWPCFLLYKIHGLRKSIRSNSAISLRSRMLVIAFWAVSNACSQLCPLLKPY